MLEFKILWVAYGNKLDLDVKLKVPKQFPVLFKIAGKNKKNYGKRENIKMF